MPKAPAYQCSVSGCPYKQPCPKHGKSPEDRAFYGTQEWRHISEEQLELFPWCRTCMLAGRGLVPATVCDHIKPRRNRGDDSRSNLQSLCSSCHAKKRSSEREVLGLRWTPRRF